MKLFYAKGACSVAVDVAFRELGLDLELERVDLKEHTTETGTDYTQINPKGYVPTLQLDSGEYLTEAGVVLEYLADQKPEAKLIPQPLTLARYRVEEWLGFIATELHKGFGPLHNKNAPEDMRQAAIEKLQKRFAYLNESLEGKEFLMGSQFTVADTYCFAVMRWTEEMKIDLSAYPNLQPYIERIKARPSAQAAYAFEGLQ